MLVRLLSDGAPMAPLILANIVLSAVEYNGVNNVAGASPKT